MKRFLAGLIIGIILMVSMVAFITTHKSTAYEGTTHIGSSGRVHGGGY